MEKKMYIYPLTRIECFETALMYITGEASGAPDPSSAPARKPELGGNAPVF